MLEMKEKNVEVNLVTINTLISCASSFAGALQCFGELQERRIAPTINTFITLLKKANSSEQVLLVNKLLGEARVEKNNNWDRMLAQNR